ncbi:hypothetical protein PC116_g29602 [Phytophthora cactorum]|nr:hypothetical protein PC116_g29602 [Phytophthora cactorum]
MKDLGGDVTKTPPVKKTDLSAIEERTEPNSNESSESSLPSISDFIGQKDIQNERQLLDETVSSPAVPKGSPFVPKTRGGISPLFPNTRSSVVSPLTNDSSITHGTGRGRGKVIPQPQPPLPRNRFTHHQSTPTPIPQGQKVLDSSSPSKQEQSTTALPGEEEEGEEEEFTSSSDNSDIELARKRKMGGDSSERSKKRAKK